MNTVDGIVTEVRRLFGTESGVLQIARLTRYLAELDASSDVLRAQVRRLRERAEAEFFATVGSFRKPRLKLDVRTHGRKVGSITLGPAAAPRIFERAKAFTTAGTWRKQEWGNPHVKLFLREARLEVEKEVTEAMVQSGLFTALAERSGARKQKLLLHHQPVLLAGLPFQFPLPVVASRRALEVADGGALAHADVIARYGRGGAPRLRVFEIKKPWGAGDALAQAVAYAAALHLLMEIDRAVYLRTLGIGATRKIIKIDAAAFVHETARDAVLRSAKALQRANNYFELHAFFYRLDGTDLVVTGSERVGTSATGTRPSQPE